MYVCISGINCISSNEGTLHERALMLERLVLEHLLGDDAQAVEIYPKLDMVVPDISIQADARTVSCTYISRHQTLQNQDMRQHTTYQQIPDIKPQYTR